MKIIHLSASYKPAYIYGGPTMSVSLLCEQLQNQKLAIEVLTTTANGNRELAIAIGKPIQVDGVTVTYYPRLTKDHTHFSPLLLVNLVRKIRLAQRQTSQVKNNTDIVVHIHAWWNLVSILSCQLAKWRGVPVVLSPRGMLTSYTLGNKNTGIKSIIHWLLGKRLLKYCHIHATSEKEKDDILQIVKPKSITVIPNLVRFGAIHEQTANATVNQDFKLIYLSRIEEKKGLEVLFEALAALQIKWTLTIAGTGHPSYVDKLKQKTIDLQIASKIVWLGHVTNEEKFKYLTNHDLLVLVSQNENFANVVIESLSVGTPVLLSSAVGLSNYVAANHLGWITSTHAGEISKRITAIAKDRSQLASIKKVAPGLISKDFNEQTLIARYISYYENICLSS